MTKRKKIEYKDERKITPQDKVMRHYDLAEKRPELSANEIAEFARDTGYGIKRDNALAIVKKVREKQARVLIDRVDKDEGIKFQNRERIKADIQQYSSTYRYKKINTINKRLYEREDGKPHQKT